MAAQRVALITGASSGIGAASAIALAKREFAIVIGDLHHEAGEKSVKNVLAASPNAKVAFCKLDVTSEEQWTNAVNFTVKRYGRLTTLVNNAGIGAGADTLEQTTLKSWENVHRVNATGPFLGCRAASAELTKAGKEGSIINISSLFALVGGFGNMPSGLSFFKGRREITYQISSNCVCSYRSKMQLLASRFHSDGTSEEELKGILSMVPMGRHGTPEEIAKAVAFLATDDSSFMTGSELVIDGGWLCK